MAAWYLFLCAFFKNKRRQKGRKFEDAGGTPAIAGRGGLAIRPGDPGARVWELPTVKR